jgi:hypothetical protein
MRSAAKFVPFYCPLSQNPKMSWKPEQQPDRHTAEDDKPDKRKADNQVVSVHGRLCRMMSGLASSAILGGADALAERPHPILLLGANHLRFRARKSRDRARDAADQ